jgi:hypothetical protein
MRRFAERQVRAAQDESDERDVNEQIGETSIRASLAEYTCECPRGCDVLVSLTADEYEAVRSVPTHFVVAPGHLLVGVEVVVRENSRFTVVEKIGAAAPVARARDSRSLSSPRCTAPIPRP